MEICSFLLLIILSAFFSGSEIAFASVNKIRLKKASEAGNGYAKTALYIYEHFEDALSTILIGNNLVNIAASSIATVIAIGFMGDSGAVAATFLMTILILIFGEITPKIIAKQQCDKFTLLVSYPLRFLMLILKPVIVVIVSTVNLVSKLWKDKVEKEPSITEQELVTLIESVADDGVIDEGRSELLQSALEFSNISAYEIITPRIDMTAIDINDDMDAITEVVLNSPYSRIPVYEDSIDNIIGILHVERFLKERIEAERIDLRSILIDVCFIHKTMKLPVIFSELKRRQLQMAIVNDEYGGTMGCITMEDVLEQLVGAIWDESDEVFNDFVKVNENTYEVSGDLKIHEFWECLDMDDHGFDSDYTTVGGWAIEMLNGFPEINNTFEYKNLAVKVIALDGQRVSRLSVYVSPVMEDSELLGNM